MSAPLSNELFFTVHRGIYLKPESSHTYSEQRPGVHWSANPEVAEEFAKRRGYKGSKRVVLHSEVPISSVETNRKVYVEKAAEPEKHPGEEEILVKEKSPLFLTGRTTYRGYNKTKSRKRTYNPPREVQA